MSGKERVTEITERIKKPIYLKDLSCLVFKMPYDVGSDLRRSMNKNNVLNLIAFMIVGALMGFVLYLFWTIAGQAVKEISIVSKTLLNNLTTVILIVGVIIGGMAICPIVSWAIGRVFNFFMPKDDYIEKIKESCKEADKAIRYEDKMKQLGRKV